MKVSKLIELLQKCDPEAEVYIQSQGGIEDHAEVVKQDYMPYRNNLQKAVAIW